MTDKVKKKVVVIGAGIAGASAAAAIADCCEVTVLERESQPGYHSTGRSAATWAPFYGPQNIQELTALSLPLLSNPDSGFSDKPFTSPKGELMLGRKGDEAEIEKHRALGMQSLSCADALELVPLIKTANVESVLYTDNMLDIDVDALHQAYIRYFKKNQGTLICDTAVNSLIRENNKWKLQTSNGTFESDVVINAAGAWADHIATLAGTRTIGIQPKRRSAALVPYAEGSNMPRWPMVFGAGENFYCTPFGNGLMISPADETPVEAHDAWPEDLDIATGIDEFQKYINYDIPRIDHQWAGLRTFTPDGAPVVGFATDTEGFFWLAGQGGYGIQTSPAIAAICRNLIGGSKIGTGLFAEVNTSHCMQLDASRFE